MMSKPDTWMPLYVGDYLADTTRLTTEQHGAYLLLILDYWRNGPPPDDESTLQQITKLDRAGWKRCGAVLRAKFRIDAGVWRHKRIDEELASQAEFYQRAVAKAKRAAEARWGRDPDSPDDPPSNATSNATSMHEAMPGAMHDQCKSQSQSQSQKALKTFVATATPGFDRFWQTWPRHKRKVAKEQCLARWRSAGLEPSAEQICQHVEALKRSADWLKDNGEYIPAPLVYLRQDRYDAPVETPVAVRKLVAL